MLILPLNRITLFLIPLCPVSSPFISQATHKKQKTENSSNNTYTFILISHTYCLF